VNTWDYLNSPFVLTLISLIIGSLIATWITALWQKRSQQYQIKLQYAQEVINIYQEYARLLRNNKVTAEDIDKIHPRFLASVKIIGYLFKDKRVGQNWTLIASKFSNIYGLRKQGKDKTMIVTKSEEIYDDFSQVIKIMFKELS